MVSYFDALTTWDSPMSARERLSTSGGHTVWISAFFSAFISMLMFTIWWQVGHFVGQSFFWVKGRRCVMSRKNDTMIIGTDEYANRHGWLPGVTPIPQVGTSTAEGKS